MTAERKKLKVPQPGWKEARFSHVGGSKDDAWNESLMNYVSRALPTSSETFSKERQSDEKVAAVVGLMECKPSDPLEAMLIGQIISANATALELQRRAWVKDQSFECRTKFLALADRSARTMATLIEALNRHRGKGQQIVRVERVTVHEGGQAIVGPVSHQGGGRTSKSEEQPQAKQLSHAPGETVLGQIEENREALPVASGDGT